MISSPQLALTDSTLTSSTPTPAAAANASWTCVRTSAGWSSTCTLMMSPLSDARSWIFADDALRPFSSRIASASSMVICAAGTSQATPPAKSIPSTS